MPRINELEKNKNMANFTDNLQFQSYQRQNKRIQYRGDPEIEGRGGQGERSESSPQKSHEKKGPKLTL